MATPFAITDAKIYLSGYDLSGSSNSVSIAYEFPGIEVTSFGSDCHYKIPGIPDLNIEAGGFAMTDGTDESEDVIEALLGTANTPVSIGYSGADGTPGYFTKMMEHARSLGGPIGEAFGFQIQGCAQGYKLVRGYYLAPRASRTSSDTGTAKEISAVTATQKVYSALHVFAASGTSPTLDVIVASDENTDFGSAVTRITHTQFDDVGSEIKSVDGAITDDCWRVGWTIGGTDDPTFDFAVLVGII